MKTIKGRKFIILTGLVFFIICIILSFKIITVEAETNYVPDAETAKRIAEALWGPVYGEEHIEKEKPFKAELKEGVWIVQGTLKEGYRGGCAYIEIRQSDCKVLKLTHYK